MNCITIALLPNTLTPRVSIEGHTNVLVPFPHSKSPTNTRNPSIFVALITFSMWIKARVELLPLPTLLSQEPASGCPPTGTLIGQGISSLLQAEMCLATTTGNCHPTPAEGFSRLQQEAEKSSGRLWGWGTLLVLVLGSAKCKTMKVRVQDVNRRAQFSILIPHKIIIYLLKCEKYSIQGCLACRPWIIKRIKTL